MFYEGGKLYTTHYVTNYSTFGSQTQSRYVVISLNITATSKRM